MRIYKNFIGYLLPSVSLIHRCLHIEQVSTRFFRIFINMKTVTILLLFAMVAIAAEKLQTKYILVKINEAKRKGTFSLPWFIVTK